MADRGGPRPPGLIERTLRVVLADGVVARSIVGDLAEDFGRRAETHGVFRARWWYRRQALGLLARGAWARVWDRDGWATRARSEDSVGRRGDTMLTVWMTELGRAVRSLARAPGFTVVTVLTLGLAISANAAIFSVVDGVLLEGLPYDDPDRLVSIKSSTPGNNTPPVFEASPEFYVHFKDGASALAGAALYSTFGGTARLGGASERIRGAEVTYDFFELLGVEPVLGRLPTLADVEGRAPPSRRQETDVDIVLISHFFWTQTLGGDPGVIGTSVDLNNRMRTIIGVLPPELRLPHDDTAIWVPFHMTVDNVRIGRFTWGLIGRLAQDSDIDQLVAQLAPIADRLPEIYSSATGYVRFMEDGQFRPVVQSFETELVGDLQRPLFILLGTVGFVLLIACANVANLFLVRAESRQRDMAIRAAMGAGRATLVRTHLAEALVLAAASGALGAVLAWVAVPLLVAAAPAGIPRIDLVRLDGGVLAFTGVLSLGSALLFGLAAAIRYSSPRLLTRLRSAGRGAIGGRDRHLARNALVVTQSGLALVLLVGSGLLVKSFAELTNTDPGFDAGDRLTFQTALPFESYPTASEVAAFHTSIMGRMASLPGVRAVGAVQTLPIDEDGSGTSFTFDEPTTGEDAPSIIQFTYASHGYFEALGIDLVAGRTFVRADHETDLGNAIISRSIADRVWPGEDPIGKRLRRSPDPSGWETVVGVVEDVRDRDLRQEPRGLVYLPLVSRNPETSWLVPSPAYVIHADNPTGLAAAVRDEIRRADPDLPVYRMQTMEDIVADSVEQLSFTMLALGVSAFMALVLGAVGLYGVLSYLVSQRTQEIGVRLALGAEAGEVRRMVVSQGARLALAGLAAGLIVSGALTRVLEGLLYGTEPLDATTFVGMSTIMLLVCLLASYLPARRASAVDPVESMRAE